MTPSEAYQYANGSNGPSQDSFSSNTGEEREKTNGANGPNGTNGTDGPLTFSAKLGHRNRIYIPRRIVQQIGATNTTAAITIRTLNNQVTFLAKMHEETYQRRRITIPTYVRQHLQIKRNDTLKINIRIPTTNRPTELFQNDKIDLLALIPPKTSRGEFLQVDADENKIRLWYKSLCSPRTVELNRYQNPETLGALLGAMDNARKLLTTNKPNGLTKKLADGFIAKLCTGDGSFIAWKGRRRQRPDVNPILLIADGNEKYLRDYQKILENRDFKKVILETQHRRVQAQLSWNDVFLLYAIKAFTGTANYRQLIATIAFYLQYNRNGRRYAMLLDLASRDTFTTNDIMKQGLPYDKARSYAKYMLKKGYIQVVAIGDHGQKNLSLTDKGAKLIALLMQWKQEYQTLKKITNLDDPLTILNTLPLLPFFSSPTSNKK